MAMFGACAAHQCEVPLAGVIIAENITSLALGDRMLARELKSAEQVGDGRAELAKILRGVQEITASHEMPVRSTEPGRKSGAALAAAMQGMFEKDLEAAARASTSPSLATSLGAVASVHAAETSGRALIYLAPGPKNGAALRINPTSSGRPMCESVELPDLDIESVRASVGRTREAYAAALHRQLGQKALTRVVVDVLDSVSSGIWAPLLRAWPDLRAGRAALVPLGEAALLPLYTAPVDGKAACSVLDVTVVPSARALLLSAKWPMPPTSDVFVAADPWHGPSSIPHTVHEARTVAAVHSVDAAIFRTVSPEEPGLLRPGVADDAAALRAHREEEPALSTLAVPVPPGISRRLAAATLIHLACHGDLQSSAPLDSSLLLGEERVSLASLLGSDLRAGATVVLSACELGSITGDLPDEQLGFPAAMLAMGARSVIGALWPVPDGAETVDLMASLHQSLAGGTPATLALGEAIGRAQSCGVPAAVWAPFTHFGA